MVDAYWGVDLDAPVDPLDLAISAVYGMTEGDMIKKYIGSDLTLYASMESDNTYRAMVFGPMGETAEEDGFYRLSTAQMVADYVEQCIGRVATGVDVDLAGTAFDRSNLETGRYL